jgi:hypothetical protein
VRDPEAAKELRRLVVGGVLVQAAELGYITEVKCGMPKCFCPEELGGAWHFDPVADTVADWMPTHEHSRSQSETGYIELPRTRSLPTASATGIDFSIAVGRPHGSDLERIRRAREAATGH